VTAGRTFRLLGCAFFAAGLLITSACQTSKNVDSSDPSPVAAAQPAGITIEPADETSEVQPTATVTVTAEGGDLVSVDVKAADGAVLDGQVSGSTWTSTAALSPAQTYTVHADAVNADGMHTTVTSTFTTITPREIIRDKVQPLNGETVGVGMPIIVQFTAPVTDRAAVIKALQVEMSEPVEGAWRWVSKTEVHYRPREYWPVGQKVTLHVNLAGVDAGDGVWGDRNRSISFTVGEAHVSTVDATTHQMTVKVNGEVARTFPVSTGRDAYPTASGVHVVLEKQPTRIMDSATVGIPKGKPGYYRMQVDWDVRISWSGEFVHSAPWSVDSQGNANVSHGCVNAAPADAEWFYNLSRRGDIVDIVGTPKTLESGNGITDWNLTWGQWTSGPNAT
jgi:lipoprotein-anchoring transpeptidase ErfK/SrfK